MTVDGRPKRAAVAEFRLGDVYVGQAVLGRQLTRLQPCPTFSITAGSPARAATCGCQNSVRAREISASRQNLILAPHRHKPNVALLRQIRGTGKRRARRPLSGIHSEGCRRKSDPISARSSASFSRGTRRCWGGLNRGRSWRRENRSASQKRRQPWLTFSISLIPGLTSPPARRGTKRVRTVWGARTRFRLENESFPHESEF